jgi:A/G-specific adenine glycosylase
MGQPLFSDALLSWYEKHGRHDFPWQQKRSLYRIWLAENMLQQTQVATVIPYYQRFLESFPDLSDLISASLDDVLVLWAGLGYYTRARNLHKAAQVIAREHHGCFPEQYEEVLALPGIGRSTAGAILAQALDQRYVILDGNVKRVLCRYFAIEGWPGKREVENTLWLKAEACTPHERPADYTQAIMDMGAIVCSRGVPACTVCPLQQGCQALNTGQVIKFPTPRPRKPLPVKATRMLLLTNGCGEILLEKRPPSGIWGGLWSLPEMELEQDIGAFCKSRWGYRTDSTEDIPGLRHTFSHYHLDITPCKVAVRDSETEVREPGLQQWCGINGIESLALASPVAGLIQQHFAKAQSGRNRE